MAIATEAASPATRILEQPRQMLTSGEWVEARDGHTVEVYDPANGDIIDQVPADDAEDVGVAVIAARRAFQDSDRSRITVSDARRVIWRIGDLIPEHAGELAEIESLDNGKPVDVARIADIPLAADLFRCMAGFRDQNHRTRSRSRFHTRRR